MKERPSGFLANDKIPHDSEVFDYIKELHEYLWRFARIAMPGVCGRLELVVDRALDKLEEMPADARRYRFLTSGDSSITVHENGGPPVGFFCGTRDQVSEQIDAELAREGPNPVIRSEKAIVRGDTWGTHTEFDLDLPIEAELSYEGEPMKVKSVTTSPAAIVTMSFDEDGEPWITGVTEPKEDE